MRPWRCRSRLQRADRTRRGACERRGTDVGGATVRPHRPPHRRGQSDGEHTGGRRTVSRSARSPGGGIGHPAAGGQPGDAAACEGDVRRVGEARDVRPGADGGGAGKGVAQHWQAAEGDSVVRQVAHVCCVCRIIISRCV